MFSIDLIDPYWPWDLQRRFCDEIIAACAKHEVTIRCSFGGHHGHQRYIGHPDEACRRQGENFIHRAIRQTAYLGGRSFGTCFAIQSVHCHNDPPLRGEILDDAITAYHRIAEYGAEVDLEALAYEMMSVPRETCATFEGNDYVLQRCSGMAIPLRICLDMGHRNLAGPPEQADHLAWIRRYGKHCVVIDCQQSDMAASRHWPFTPEYNEQRVVRGNAVVAAIEESGAEEILLALGNPHSSLPPAGIQPLGESKGFC